MDPLMREARASPMRKVSGSLLEGFAAPPWSRTQFSVQGGVVLKAFQKVTRVLGAVPSPFCVARGNGKRSECHRVPCPDTSPAVTTRAVGTGRLPPAYGTIHRSVAVVSCFSASGFEGRMACLSARARGNTAGS